MCDRQRSISTKQNIKPKPKIMCITKPSPHLASEICHRFSTLEAMTMFSVWLQSLPYYLPFTSANHSSSHDLGFSNKDELPQKVIRWWVQGEWFSGQSSVLNLYSIICQFTCYLSGLSVIPVLLAVKNKEALEDYVFCTLIVTVRNKMTTPRRHGERNSVHWRETDIKTTVKLNICLVLFISLSCCPPSVSFRLTSPCLLFLPPLFPSPSFTPTPLSLTSSPYAPSLSLPALLQNALPRAQPQRNNLFLSPSAGTY